MLSAKINRRGSGTSAFASVNPHGISISDMARIKAALSACQKLEAIRIVREVTGMGLADAKNYVEQDLMNGTPSSRPSSVKCKQCQSIYAADMPNCPSCGRSTSLNQVSTPTSSANNGGCYIATCVYGSYDCPQVWTLRRYRDNTLGATWYGRLFIRVYYVVSPTLVKWFGKTSWFKCIWQGKLDKMVAKLNGNGVENTPYQDKEW